MFQPKKKEKEPEIDQTKIRLPRLTAAPDRTYLGHIHSQAMEHMGQEVEATWTNANNQKIYSLIVKVPAGNTQPSWLLWEDNGAETKMIWSYQTPDLDLLYDLFLMLQPPTPEAPEAEPEPQPTQPSPGLETSQAPPLTHSRPSTDVPKIQPSFDDTAAGRAMTAISKAARDFMKASLVGMKAMSAITLQGEVEKLPVATFLKTIAATKQTGKLEITGNESVGSIYFESGAPTHAHVASKSGDPAIVELVAWQKGSFRFLLDDRTPMRSVNHTLEDDIAAGFTLLDQKRHLDGAKLTPESYLVKKHKQLSDSELKVFLMKGASVDFNQQIEIYRNIGARCTLADLLRDRPMETSVWVPIIFNFLACGLIEIKPQDAMAASALEFLGESKGGAQGVETQLLRPETGILTYPALLYFLQYEFYRYEAYGWPLTLLLFAMNRRKAEAGGGVDLLKPEEINTAIKRLELVKRPLDSIGHLEMLDYALLLPNTRASSGSYVANRACQALLAAPLSQEVDRKHLQVAFGVASIPGDGDNLETLLLAGKAALKKAKNSDFPIILARSLG